MNEDFVDLLRAFIAADVRFMVVGAYALAIHGRPRATGDLDIWVDRQNEGPGRHRWNRVRRSLRRETPRWRAADQPIASVLLQSTDRRPRGGRGRGSCGPRR